MRLFVGSGLVSALVVSLAVPVVQAGAAPQPTPDQQVRAAASGGVSVSRDPASDRVEFVRVTGTGGDLAPGPAARTARAVAAKASGWLDDHGELFGIATDQLVLSETATSDRGSTLTYTQQYRGVPVWGTMLRVNIDAEGALRSVNGHVVPDLDLALEPRASAGAAEAAAVRLVRSDPPTDHEGEPTAVTDPSADATLVVYETGSPLGRAGTPLLAWDVQVAAGASVRERVVLDAHELKPLNRYSEAHAALDRTLISNDDRGTAATTDDTESTWTEGQAMAGLAQDQLNLIESAGEAYRLFANSFGRDSYDGAGATMVTLHNRQDSCPNASWDRTRTSYCSGVDSDDIVAHEWGHAYTEHTSGLIYQWQSGALNESYSDVWGETLDLLNQREDDGENDAVRAEGTCSGRMSDLGSSVDRTVQLTVNGYACVALEAQFGLRLSNATQQITIVPGLDAANAVGPLTTDGCTELTNASAVAGNWALLDRGTCQFARKSRMAAAAGARGMVIVQNSADAPTSASGSGVLPMVMVRQADGAAIRAMTGTITGALSSPRANDTSFDRWLVGEKSSGFGGAIRDVWNPNCAGDPAKVGDAEYVCDTVANQSTDYGRVHSHSGVPNRAYSLFVDGGTFNGQSVAGVGLDKAAHVWWRAGAAYLTPTSDFADFAAALGESCRTLQGQPIAKLSTGAPAGAADALTAGNCAQLEKVIVATELRTDMAERCDFEPLLASGEPAGCGEGLQTENLLAEDFEDGLGDFVATAEASPETASPGPTAWTTATGPRGGTGRAAFAANPMMCGAGSLAGLSTLVSPQVTITEGVSPRLRFRHQVNLEKGYDGARVSLRVNGGAWAAVPQAAFLWNAPSQLLTDWPTGSGTTHNPLLGERVWTGGAEPQTAASRWGVSVVDLVAAGVATGDVVQVRFELGTDQCDGALGWFVDDVSISHCVEAVTPTTPPPTTPPPTTPATSVPTSVPTTVPTTTPTKAPVVAKKASRVSVRASPNSPRRGKRFRLTATVSPRTSGTVTFWVDGRRVASAKVSKGTAKAVVSAKRSKQLRRGRHVLRATFSGNSLYRGATAQRAFTVRR